MKNRKIALVGEEQEVLWEGMRIFLEQYGYEWAKKESERSEERRVGKEC